jgi:hypothetical protein
MKKLRIATNIALVVKLLFWIGIAILLFYSGMDEAGKAAQQTAQQAGEQSVTGAVVGGVFAGVAVAIFVVLGVFLFAIPVLFTIIILIIYNVKKKPSIGLGVFTIITSCITAGILIIVQRNKMLEETSVEE